MSLESSDWTYHDFLAYLLIYAASADFVITEEEKTLICTKVGEESYNKIMEKYQKDGNYQGLQTIIDLSDKYFPKKEDKMKLLKDMQEIFMADDEFSGSEKRMFKAFEIFLTAKLD